MTGPEPFPETILRLRTALYPSFALLAGIQLDVFSYLRNGPKSVEQLAHALNVAPGKLHVLLYALVAADLLSVDGGTFANTSEADLFLVRGEQRYLGAAFEAIALDRWNALWRTAESIRTGSAQAKVDWESLSQEAKESFFRAQHPSAVRAANDLLAKYDFSSCRHLVDVGGGTGGLAIAMTKAYPGIRATVVDLPTITPITERYVSEAGASDRVQVMAADVVNGPLSGSYDVAVLGGFIPVLSFQEAQRAVRNVSQVIEPGGTVYINDGGTLDDSRLTPIDIVWQNLWFINVFDHGEARTEEERRQWLAEAGLEAGERVTYPDGRSTMVAKKPA